jgi:hypothetical protein
MNMWKTFVAWLPFGKKPKVISKKPADPFHAWIRNNINSVALKGLHERSVDSNGTPTYARRLNAEQENPDKVDVLIFSVKPGGPKHSDVTVAHPTPDREVAYWQIYSEYEKYLTGWDVELPTVTVNIPNPSAVLQG